MSGTKLKQFRENPKRSIFVTGEINQSLVDKLTPQIIAFRADGKEPITVYIDSLGGSTFHARLLLELLTGPNQDREECQIVTVVTGRAASAAADIMAAGSYSICYRHALILYHGVRTSLGSLTHESASSLAESLKQSNEGFALELAERVLRRFFFVYAQLKRHFEDIRTQKPGASEVECLASNIRDRLTGRTGFLDTALIKHTRLNRLRDYYNTRRAERGDNFARTAEREAFLLECLIAWELQENQDESWGFDTSGLNLMREDFILLSDFEDGRHMQDLESQIKQWGSLLLNATEQVEYTALPETSRQNYLLEHTRDRFRAVWHFLVSLCRALQQGENQLTPTEAYWLGLIDEVPGSNLPSLREMMERFFDEEAKQKKPATSSTKKRQQTTKKRVDA